MATVVVIALATLVLGASPAIAGKPQEVIARSNGYPSGPHFNLNIHGKSWDACNAVLEGDGTWGTSIFIPEYGEATIEYLSNKNASVTTLTVLDPCSGFDGDSDVAKVQLPYKVEVNGVLTEADGYYVFARIRGKPNNSQNCDGPAKNCPPSSIVLYPNVITQACSDSTGTQIDCLWALGLITQQDMYVAAPEGFLRFDPATTQGEGKSSGRDISRLFTWSGYVFYGGSPDTNGDGIIDETDIPGDAVIYVRDLDSNGSISLYEWKAAHADFNGDGVVNQADLDAAYAEAPAGLSPNTYVANVGGDLLIVDLYDWQAYHPDSNGDGLLSEADVLPGAETYVTDLDGNGVISVTEWLEYQESIGTCVHYDTPLWIFNIADLVVTQQDVVNDGSKLLQLRFYPVATTEYVAPGYIMVDNVTIPSSDPQIFDFALTGGPESIVRQFQLQDTTSPYDSGSIPAGSYTLTETLPSGWSLTGISILDPDGGSSSNLGTATATVDVDPSETVIVTFTNTKQ